MAGGPGWPCGPGGPRWPADRGGPGWPADAVWRGGRWAEGASPEAGEDFPAPVPHAGSAVPRLGRSPAASIASGRMTPCPVPRRPAAPEPVRAAVRPSRRSSGGGPVPRQLAASGPPRRSPRGGPALRGLAWPCWWRPARRTARARPGPPAGSRAAGSRAAVSGSAHPATAAGPAAGSRARSAGPLTLQVSPAPYQLPSGLAREVVLPAGPDLLLAGGLTPRSTSTAAVRRAQPVDGQHGPGGASHRPHA